MKRINVLFLMVVFLISCSKPAEIKSIAVTPQDIIIKQTDINAQADDIIKIEQRQIDPSNPFEATESVFLKKYGIENSSYKGALIEYTLKDRKIYADVYIMKNAEDAEKRMSFTLDLIKDLNVNAVVNTDKIGDKNYVLESSSGLAGHYHGILFRKGNVVASVSISRVDKISENEKEEAVALAKVMENKIG